MNFDIAALDFLAKVISNISVLKAQGTMPQGSIVGNRFYLP